MYWNNKKIKIKVIIKNKTTKYNKLNKKNKPQISIIFASICSYSLLFTYIHLFLLLSKKMQENKQDHPIRMQEKRARPPHINAREKNKWTTYKNTKNLRNTIYKNTKRHVAIPQEHQRHKLATIPITIPTTTSTTTPAMTPTRTTPMCCLAQSVRKSLYFMPKSVFL